MMNSCLFTHSGFLELFFLETAACSTKNQHYENSVDKPRQLQLNNKLKVAIS